jgi:hypothetical protein
VEAVRPAAEGLGFTLFTIDDLAADAAPAALADALGRSA